MTSYKNGVYQQIALDNPSSVGIATLVWVTTIYIILNIPFFLKTFLKNRETRKKLLILRSGKPPDAEPEITLDSLWKSQRIIQVSMYLNSLLLIFVLVNQYVSIAKLSYINLADAHYHQVLRVASRFLEAHDHAEVESDFAQISRREDYVRVLSKLEDQCKAHGLTVPEFVPW
jgi:hypothetical protein